VRVRLVDVGAAVKQQRRRGDAILPARGMKRRREPSFTASESTAAPRSRHIRAVSHWFSRHANQSGVAELLVNRVDEDAAVEAPLRSFHGALSAGQMKGDELIHGAGRRGSRRGSPLTMSQ